MNTDQFVSNLTSVKEAARGIIENIEAVRGPKHAALTMSLVHSSMVTDVFCMLKQASRMSPDTLDMVSEVYLHHLHEMLRCLTSAGSISEKEVVEAIDEARSVENVVQSMARKALEMAEAGKSYGGKSDPV